VVGVKPQSRKSSATYVGKATNSPVHVWQCHKAGQPWSGRLKKARLQTTAPTTPEKCPTPHKTRQQVLPVTTQTKEDCAKNMRGIAWRTFVILAEARACFAEPSRLRPESWFAMVRRKSRNRKRSPMFVGNATYTGGPSTMGPLWGHFGSFLCRFGAHRGATLPPTPRPGGMREAIK
jgi:hypothetical protein